MSWDHSLRPDRDSKNLLGVVRMKEHPDRQPRRAVTMHRRNHDDGKTDQNFERDRIDGYVPNSYSVETVVDKSLCRASREREFRQCTAFPASS